VGDSDGVPSAGYTVTVGEAADWVVCADRYELSVTCSLKL
jgi:hypothetical protein